MTQTLQGALHDIVALQAHLPVTSSVLLGVAALGAVTVPGISGLTQHFNTMAHEGAHAAMGSVTGRRVTAMTLRGNGEGRTSLTTSAPARSGWPRPGSSRPGTSWPCCG